MGVPESGDINILPMLMKNMIICWNCSPNKHTYILTLPSHNTNDLDLCNCDTKPLMAYLDCRCSKKSGNGKKWENISRESTSASRLSGYLVHECNGGLHPQRILTVMKPASSLNLPVLSIRSRNTKVSKTVCTAMTSGYTLGIHPKW